MCARLPDLREKFLCQCCLQISNAVRAARTAFHTEHPLDHQNVMVSPERDILIMVNEQVLHYEKISVFFRLRKDLDDRGDPLLMGRNGKPLAARMRPKTVRQTRALIPLFEPPVGKIVKFEEFEDLFVFEARDKFHLSKLH